jgi:hypothetical protein
MSEPALELVDDDAPLTRAAADAARGVVTHLTIHGERVAVIVPESVIEALSGFAILLTAEHALTALPEAMPWAKSLPPADLPALAADLAAAAASGPDAPEQLAAVLLEWQATAEIYTDPDEAERLRQAIREAREGKATPWQYDDEAST